MEQLMPMDLNEAAKKLALARWNVDDMAANALKEKNFLQPAIAMGEPFSAAYISDECRDQIRTCTHKSRLLRQTPGCANDLCVVSDIQAIF
jgi:hypothetical protein